MKAGRIITNGWDGEAASFVMFFTSSNMILFHGGHREMPEAWALLYPYTITSCLIMLQLHCSFLLAR
jgi:hypothetical protein